MTHDFDESILAIADASPADFAKAMATLPRPTNDFQDDFKMALRDAVMAAFDETTRNHSSTDLKDEHLPQLFETIDDLAETLYNVRTSS